MKRLSYLINFILLAALGFVAVTGQGQSMAVLDCGPGGMTVINNVAKCIEVAPTPESTPTVTPAPEPTLTNTPTPSGHNVSNWHSPSDGHHHGAAPLNDVHPAIIQWLTDNDSVWSEIGHPWLSSPTENDYPYPGKHQGFVNLHENDTGCPRNDPGGAFPNDQCIMAYYLQLHSLSTSHAFRTDIHSWKGVFYVCDWPGLTECGIVASGGHSNYGEQHSQYKNITCNLPGQPNYPGSYTHNLPPYVSVQGRDENRKDIFWSSLTTLPTLNILGDVNMLGKFAWDEQAWSLPHTDGDLCADPDFDTVFCPNGSCSQNGTNFQVYTILVEIEDYPRPYIGFVDVNGIESDCTEMGANCIPLLIEVGVPDGNATLNRKVQEPYAPVLDYDDGTVMIMPGHE